MSQQIKKSISLIIMIILSLLILRTLYLNLLTFDKLTSPDYKPPPNYNRINNSLEMIQK